MKNKTWLRVVLVVLAAIFLRLAFRPAEPDAPVANVWGVVEAPTPTVIDDESWDDVAQWEENNDTENDEWEEDDEQQNQADEWEVDVVLPDAPLADTREIDSFDNEISGEWTSYALVAWSQVERLGKKVGGQHNGLVDISEGELYVEDGSIVEGRFVMDMTTITATDITDEGLDNKLKEWFNTDEYATAEFFLNEASSTQVSGVMTINGQSREISFPATVIVEEDTVIANADFALDRTLRWVTDGTPAVSEFMEISFNLTWLAE